MPPIIEEAPSKSVTLITLLCSLAVAMSAYYLDFPSGFRTGVKLFKLLLKIYVVSNSEFAKFSGAKLLPMGPCASSYKAYWIFNW